jgi:hypothetical protein
MLFRRRPWGSEKPASRAPIRLYVYASMRLCLELRPPSAVAFFRAAAPRLVGFTAGGLGMEPAEEKGAYAGSGSLCARGRGGAVDELGARQAVRPLSVSSLSTKAEALARARVSARKPA